MADAEAKGQSLCYPSPAHHLAQRLTRPAPCAQVGFNVELGGYFSVKRNTMSIWGDTFLAQDQVVAYCKALLEVFRCAATPLMHRQQVSAMVACQLGSLSFAIIADALAACCCEVSVQGRESLHCEEARAETGLLRVAHAGTTARARTGRRRASCGWWRTGARTSSGRWSGSRWAASPCARAFRRRCRHLRPVSHLSSGFKHVPASCSWLAMQGYCSGCLTRQ